MKLRIDVCSQFEYLRYKNQYAIEKFFRYFKFEYFFPPNIFPAKNW